MRAEYIIVQAGGKGSRLGHLTANKPKALVPVDNLPMLFHLFRQFPHKRFIVIADHKKEVLREYLACFATVRYQVVDAPGTGTCGGLAQALALLPHHAPFMLVWSDLILPPALAFPEAIGNLIGISESFPCRWRYQDGALEPQASTERGVAGLFLFRDKACLAGVPQSGEFVQWLQTVGFRFDGEVGLAGTREFGLLADYEKLGQEKCRPFNRISTAGDVVTKEAVDEQGRALALLEGQWYETAQRLGVPATPKIYGVQPLRMERIDGKNVYEYGGLPPGEKRAILRRLVAAVKDLHGRGHIAADAFSMKEAYYTKTMRRLHQVRDLIPLADQRTITVNGRVCRNVFFHRRALEQKLDALHCERFAFIHGDCTFSNLMLRGGEEPVFIDPRGYFGFTELYGDANYDWAKLYYSIVGNYDRFNLKDFRLQIGAHEARVDIQSNQWEALEGDFFALSGADPATIRLLHAVIWLSLTTYAWQDYDSICGAFYNGLYYLEEVL
ncbi:MAG: NTP transferase domain-containing protein [Oscillospiraceae bacterium]